MAPISAPLGATVGTFFGPSVPVAWSEATPDSFPFRPGIGGKNATADAWSCMVNDEELRTYFDPEGALLFHAQLEAAQT